VDAGENDDLDRDLARLVGRYGVKGVAERLSLFALALLRLHQKPKRAARGRPSITAYDHLKDEMARLMVKQQDERAGQVRALIESNASPELIHQIWTQEISYIDIARKVIKEHGQPGFGTAENQAKKLVAEFDYFCLAGPVEIKRAKKGHASPRGWGAKWFSDKKKGS
jgi:hypothetical protein